MAAPQRIRKTEARLSFEALSIEGGLISPDWLAKVAQLAADGQKESDYGVPKGLQLRDEIGRYWRVAQAWWNEFATGRAGGGDVGALAKRFVPALLREAFGFSTLAEVGTVTLGERAYPIGFQALGGRVPVVVTFMEGRLDVLAPELGDGGRRRSAFGLAQEYLNAAEGSLWGMVSNGLSLRILRDNASLTRPAFIEANLERIFSEELYADFTALWLLAHASRWGREGDPASSCALEQWREAGREEGTRAREFLRRGVEEALLALGQGFLGHADNGALRAALQDGSLSKEDFFNQLLRLVYRLIFLLTVEERGLLHPKDSAEAASRLYAEGYGLKRLRERAVKRSAHDRFSDLWEAQLIVFRALAEGEPRLALPALAGIFAASQCPALDSAKLENRALLLAVFRLSWLRQASGLARVNWRDMGPEELGSVYESLLELVPQITLESRQFAFAEGGETKGNARKTSGSYYTPDSLVQVLLDSALEPVVAETIAKNPENPVEALLQLTIVDPACGSGHFLLAAARRLADHVARLKVKGTPSAEDYQRALRQVVGRCIYGVDLNPMAVELCKVSLWMEAVEPGLPLTFLNSHIQHGNALLGTTPELMGKGIPDDAWNPIEGDDRKVASALKKRNRAAAVGQRSLATLWEKPSELETEVVTRAVVDLDAASDADAAALAIKERKWDEILESKEYRHQKFVADAWCAAFVWPKQAGPLAEAAPTNDLWRQIRDGKGSAPTPTVATTVELAAKYDFLHWHLAFPQVFSRGGFDLVLGNPPWERVKLQEQEFFALRSEEIAKAVNSAARKKLVSKLFSTDPQLWEEWSSASRNAEGESHFIRQSGRYPLCGKGDVNTYAIFAEHNRAAIGPRGRAGFIVPSGIATDDTTKEYFSAVVLEGRLASLYDYRNHDGLFYDVGHRRFKFCLVTITGSSLTSEEATFVFFAESTEHVRDPARQFTLTASDIAVLNPNTGTSPTFRSRRDADINLAIYRRAGILWRDADEKTGNPWKLRFFAMFHMANDSGIFKTRSELVESLARLDGNQFVLNSEKFLPLLEAKMVHQFNHRYGDYADKRPDSQDTQLPDVPKGRLEAPGYEPLARYWISEREMESRLENIWPSGWLLGWRDICRSTDERTVIAALMPRVPVGHTIPLLMPLVAPPLIASLYSLLCSFAFDYAARQKVGGTHLTYGFLKQLPVFAPETFSLDTPWHRGISLREWILPRTLELSYTTWNLWKFADDLGYNNSPFKWQPDRRFSLRCELDAAFFHLYGISRDDTEYIMGTFPIVRRKDEKAHGEYRTKRVILEIYDEMAEAIRTSEPYQTRLDPPPADPSVAHPDNRKVN